MNTSTLTQDERCWLNMSKSLLSDLLDECKTLTASRNIMAHELGIVISGVCMYGDMTCSDRFRSLTPPPNASTETQALLNSLPSCAEAVEMLARALSARAIPSDFPSDSTLHVIHNAIEAYDLINKLIESASTLEVSTDEVNIYSAPPVIGEYVNYISMVPSILIALTEPGEYDKESLPPTISPEGVAYALEYVSLAKTVGKLSIHETLDLYSALRRKHRKPRHATN